MIPIPEQYVVQLLYENIHKIKYNRFNKTYNGCCPFCREGKSWGVKKRFYYIPEKEIAYCHNCGYSKRALTFICDLTNKTFQDVISDIKEFDGDVLLEAPKEEIKKAKPVSKLPHDCINLFDEQQVNYYKKEPSVRAAIHLIKERKLDKGINSPKTLYISLTDIVHKNRLVLPFYDSNGNIIFYQTRGLMKEDLYNRPKYLSKVGATKSLYGIHDISSDLDFVYICEGPIDSYFIKNGLAVCGIQEKSHYLFNDLQQQQINSLIGYKRVWCLDNQWVDRAALEKSFKLIDSGESIFIWPEKNAAKDFNDWCLEKEVNEVPQEWLQKNTFAGLQAKVKLKLIKPN